MTIEIIGIIMLFILFLILLNIQKNKHFKEIQKFTQQAQVEEVLNPIENDEGISEVQLLQNEIMRLKTILEDTKVIAQDATMIKSDFLTNIRHEIRTPMNSILAFSKMIEEESKEEFIRVYGYNIFKSGHNLLNLLNNIIEISEIDSGKFKINKSAINVKVFIDSVLEIHRYEAEKKGLVFSLEIDKKLPESIMIDVQRVQEILNNLVDNALKFTKEGEVKLIVLLDSFDESKHEANISFIVEDTGLGILQTNKEKIFQIFESKEVNLKAQYQGTGLGLSINKKLAVLMNGDIKVKSKFKEGSTFSLSLNNVEVVLINESYEVNDAEIDFSSIKANSTIVVIDKEQKTLDMLINSFQNTQVKVLAYKSSKDVMSVLQNTKVDLILIDIEILSMDDNAVGRVFKRITKAPIISLVEGRLNNITYHNNGVKPLGHLKKPLRKIDLFKIALKIINSQDIKVSDGQIKEVKLDEGLSFESDWEASQKYFKSISVEIDSSLQEALATNDLSSIEYFVNEISRLATLHKVRSIQIFSKNFLEKINTFDIEGMDSMLKEYDQKSRKFKKNI